MKTPPKYCYIPNRYHEAVEPSKFKTIIYERRKDINDKQSFRMSARNQKITWNNISIQLEEKPDDFRGTTTVIGTPDNEDFSLLFASFICMLSSWNCLWMKVGSVFKPPKNITTRAKLVHLVVWNMAPVLPKEMYQPLKSYIWDIREKYHIILVSPGGSNPIDWHKDLFGYSPDMAYMVNGESYKQFNII